MLATEFMAEVFWLIPLVMMVVCFVGCFRTARSRSGFMPCCRFKADEHENENRTTTLKENRDEKEGNK